MNSSESEEPAPRVHLSFAPTETYKRHADEDTVRSNAAKFALNSVELKMKEKLLGGSPSKPPAPAFKLDFSRRDYYVLVSGVVLGVAGVFLYLKFLRK